jgi:hypothetical protein
LLRGVGKNMLDKAQTGVILWDVLSVSVRPQDKKSGPGQDETDINPYAERQSKG